MSRTSIASLIAPAFVGLALLPAAAFSQTAAPAAAPAAASSADAGMAAFQFSGMINVDNVYIRSAASENDYPVLRLNKGDNVIVVGASGEWLKVLPPEGVFCLIGQMWVDARGDGTVGRVREGTNANVRVGSAINNMIARIVTTVDGGTDVKILGKAEENYKIAPPATAYVYVNKRFVDVVKRVSVVVVDGQNQVRPAIEKMPEAGGETAVGPNAPDNATPTPIDPSKAGESANNSSPPPMPIPNSGEATGPANGSATGSATGSANGPENRFAPPTTGPAVAARPTTVPSAEAQAAFDSLETRFAEASARPIGEQPIAELRSGYKILADDHTLPDSIAKTAEARVKSLAVRQELYAEFQKSQAEQQAAAARALPIAAEAKEIEQRMKESTVKRFAAVGTLHTSALRQGGNTLYRLTDPTSGRTVVYVMTTDPAIKAMEGQFVGVNGEIVEDTARKIRTVSPTSAEPVEPVDVTRGVVSAGLVPPSMTASASMGQ